MKTEGKATDNRRGGDSRGTVPFTAAAALLLALLLVGCGYHLAGQGQESISPDIRSVFVDSFANKTSEAYVENIFRTAFINQFVQGGRFKLARSRGEADAICRGTILRLQATPLAYKATTLTAEDRITVIMELFFEERESGRTVWSDSSFLGRVEYPVTTVGVTETSRKNALIKLANDSAERAYRLMLSGF